MLNHGLNKNQIRIIRDILSRNVSNIDKVSLYGSRATGKYKNYSDIDLVLYGDIDETEADHLWTCFDESLLPHKVDVTVYQQITSSPLKHHIDQQAKTLFTKQQIYTRSSDKLTAESFPQQP